MSNRNRYQEICSRTNGISVFAQYWWLNAVFPAWDAAIASKGDQVTGVWPYCTETKLGVQLLRTPALTPYLGPQILYPTDIKAANKDGFAWEVVDALLPQMPAAPYWHLALEPGQKQAGLFNDKGFELGVKQTFLLPLHVPEQELLANMKETPRKNIRQAQNELVITNEPEALPQLYAYHKHTLARKSKGIYHTLSQMQTLLDACLTHHAGTLWVARQNNTIQAIVWHVWDSQCGYYFMGAQNPEATNYKAITALAWHAIKTTQTKGIPTFDLEGSMDPGVERFYRSFGAQRELCLLLHKNNSLLWQLKERVRG